MNKKPLIYLDKINANKQHNRSVCYVTNKENIEEQLDNIYQGNEPLYMKRVYIKTKTTSYETRIYERREKQLITIDHKSIPIDEIIEIKRIS